MKRKNKNSIPKLGPVKQGDKTYFPIVTGKQARTFTAGKGVRQMGAVRVFIEMQLSPLAITSDTLEICLYIQSPKKAINDAADLLKRWYANTENLASEGYPKPCGDGTMELLEDRDFQALYRDAQRTAGAQNAELKVLGPKDDPTAFHVIRKEKRIIIPGG